MEISIEKIVYPGKALGRGADGIATFVDGALSGEVVDVTVTRNKKTFKEAVLNTVVTPSPRRIEARCPSYGACGGCSFQHADYTDQLPIKEAYVRELISPLGITVNPLVASPDVWGYRNKMEFSFFKENDGGAGLGLHKKGAFDRYISVPPCFICDEDFTAVVGQVLNFARQSGLGVYDKKTHEGFYRHLVLRKAKNTGQLLVNLVTNSAPSLSGGFFQPLIDVVKGKVSSLYHTQNGRMSDAVACDCLTLLHGAEMIEERLNVGRKEYRFDISPFSFFQTNTRGAELLYDAVLQAGGWKKDDMVLDLYCGTGTIGIVVAPYVKEVIGVEQVADAVNDANRNRDKNAGANCSFVAGSVEKWIKHGDIPSFNAMIVDPPRGGLSSKVISFIAKTLPEKIIYVSCNPATLARDIKDITAQSPYVAGHALCVDMFPHTFHVESVVSLARK
ncbi:MAG: 23S rRNA (uracil-5-)-methyltransferase RumA [Elusimicrobia bacterium RIFOXYA2_FULL_50_26]|nr:MAG: 23S rRNA (uracil-5-)-methyltransferase RumA [Elusimicrobia bacterium RIFOXYA2_FULL_50_26]